VLSAKCYVVASAVDGAGKRMGRIVSHNVLTVRRGFTLAELLVSIVVLVLILTMVSLIFSMSTEAAGKSKATITVLNNLRAFEQQIRDDLARLDDRKFVGLCYNILARRPVDRDRPVDPVTLDGAAVTRADWLVFFARGDFETIGDAGVNFGDSVFSKTARIQYGILGTYLAPSNPTLKYLAEQELGRSAVLEVSASSPAGDRYLQSFFPPMVYNTSFPYYFPTGSWDPNRNGGVYDNWQFEPRTLSDWYDPTQTPFLMWANWLLAGYRDPSNGVTNLWLGLGYVDPAVIGGWGDRLRMIPGCVGFKVQRWAEKDPVNPLNAAWVPRWWPEDFEFVPQPDGRVLFAPEKIPGTSPAVEPRLGQRIWEYYNGPVDYPEPAELPPGTPPPVYDWPQKVDEATPKNNLLWPWINRDFSGNPSGGDFRRAIKADFPKALKFTLKLVDPNRRFRSKEFVQTLPTDIDGAMEYTIVVPLE
jgi:prepilin-type N-terminal cleavage/methylation domain-containing protein